jgi:hypothetical protein|tara:strand:- start:540 stop:761 length:222 start_codon:yes stop_codon:yes gene_type:complete
MNVPSINPQLRNIISGAVVDYVFVIRENDIADVECYIDDEWNQEETMKAMSVQNARDWWNTLVHKGYERILTP